MPVWVSDLIKDEEYWRRKGTVKSMAGRRNKRESFPVFRFPKSTELRHLSVQVTITIIPRERERVIRRDLVAEVAESYKRKG